MSQPDHIPEARNPNVSSAGAPCTSRLNLSSGLRGARAIVRTLRAARRAGKVPEIIVLGPVLHKQLQDPNLTYLWSNLTRDVLFGLPVEVDERAEGWAIRVR